MEKKYEFPQKVECNNGINMINIPQMVKIRKYNVDVENLKKELRKNKCYTNKEIALILNKPLTLVEHWFRNDSSFSIPDADVWFKLKVLLKINTNEFDDSITTFEEKQNVYEKSDRFYFDDGLAPTLTSSGCEEKIIQTFSFPSKQELKLKLKDMLEDEVDEKYYLSGKQVKRIHATTYNVGRTRIQEKDWCDTLCVRDWKDPKCVDVTRKYGIFDDEKSKHQAGSVYDENGLAPTLDTMQGGWRQPCIEIKNATKKGYLEAHEGDGIDISSRMQYHRGNVQKDSIQTITTSGENDRGVVVDKPRKDIKEEEKYCEYCGKQLERKRFNGRLEDFTVFKNRKYCNRECMKKDYLKIGDNHNQTYSNAHTTARKINELILHKEVCELCGSEINLDIHHIDGNWQNNNLDNLMCLCRSCHTKYERNKDKINNELRIRKLAPREVWRLMGFNDEDFEKASKVNSNTQLYKQAGNSIVVNVLEAIFKELFNEKIK